VVWVLNVRSRWFGVAFAITACPSRALALEPDVAAGPIAPAPVPPPTGASPSSDATKAPLFAPNRNEFILVPDLGGNTDVGVELGLSLSMAGFRPNYYPFAWRVSALSLMSFKDDIRGFRPVQQFHGVRIDLPQLFSPKVRLDVRLNFLRTVNALWYGIGNDTHADHAPAPPGAGSANEYTSESVRLRSILRLKTGTLIDFAAATNLRYEFPTLYPGSKIASDVAAGYVTGGTPAFLETLSEGFIVDTRDSEFATHRGIYYQVGVGETIGSAESVSFGEVSAVLAHYVPLGRHVVFANRLIGSYKWGNIPFYELETAGVFDPFILLGGDRGLRGIPGGRFAGPLKVLTNNELRVTVIPRFRVWRWSLNVGMDTFFEAGRVFSDFAYREAVDGTGLGVKCSTGGGFFFQWDESSIFRVEVAYSPSGAGGPPVFYYLSNGLLF